MAGTPSARPISYMPKGQEGDEVRCRLGRFSPVYYRGTDKSAKVIKAVPSAAAWAGGPEGDQKIFGVWGGIFEIPVSLYAF